MKILGISAYYHDAAASIIEDGIIQVAVQEERFTRKKHDAGFPVNAIKCCLEMTGTAIDDLDALVFYDKPLLKFERLLETYYAFSPKGIRSFITSMPVWIKEKIFLKKLIIDQLYSIESFNRKKLKILFPEHHLSHAASAFYPSPFKEAAIVTMDGVGEWATASIAYGNEREIKILQELKFPHSIGLLYSAFTYFLGFRVNSGEYKLMGLAPYGRPGSPEVDNYMKIIRNELIDIRDDGSVWLNQRFFNYATGLRMISEPAWAKLFGFPRRRPEAELEQCHCDLGLAIQNITEEIVLKMAKHARKLTGSDFLCLAGGVALNCVANGKILQENIFKDVFIQPAAGDAGGAPGAALAAYHIYFEHARKTDSSRMDGMKGAYLGPDYSGKEVEIMSRKYGAHFTRYDVFEQLCADTAKKLDEGKIIGWMQGRMEFGPRALGGRSILGDPRNKDMQKILNLHIKYRESFRPFAPSVLAEDAGKHFELSCSSPYMLIVMPVVKSIRKTLPDDYDVLPLKEKLYYLRSDIPAVTHIDFSARIQTVHRETNPKYWQLIHAFKKITGLGMVVNTSFNVRGEPIVCTPEDAYRCFMRTKMDYLVIENYVFKKTDQPEWIDEDNWKEEYILD